MKLKKIRIENFKSIDKLEFDIKKYGASHTVAFVGINEVGKSNILEAMSFLETPKEEFDFLEFANQNNDSAKYVDLYFEMVLENKKLFREFIKKRLNVKGDLIDNIEINKIEKNIYLQRGHRIFSEQYILDIKKIKLNSLKSHEIIEVADVEGTAKEIKRYELKKEDEIPESEKDNFKDLDLEAFKEILENVLGEYFVKYETKVSFWKPDEKHLITSKVNLNTFKEDLNENIPLRNIFFLAGYKTKEDIKTKIEEIEKSESQLRRLEKQLSKESTKYLNSVWAGHEVKMDFRITDKLDCKVKIQDKGKKNEDNFFGMQNRSGGFKQFASLIFTISIENNQGQLKNRLILIDEPENHLHPSGIRAMRDELITIGKNNFVFLSTHSNFMIDNKTIKRNIIIKKDSNNNTLKKPINDYNDIVDDEVLKDAFGINVFKDFLTPNKLLVEGASDKVVLEKSIKKFDSDFNVGITNGKGDNSPSIASLLKFHDIPPLVILDADKRGRQNKEAIIKTGIPYSAHNVFTIRDIEGNLPENSTMEDNLPRDFIINKFKELYKEYFDTNISPKLNKEKPIIKEIKLYLQQNLDDENRYKIEEFLLKLKTKVSNDFVPTNMEAKTPLLYSLVEKIIKKIKEP